LEGLGTDQRIESEWILEIGWEDVEWFQLAQERGQGRAVVNVVINLRVLAPRR
jgi:hypothetical protein